MKALVLTSGGLDSATCLALSIEEYGVENVSAMSIRYGQTLQKEVESAKALADYYGVPHIVADLTELFKGAKCSLISESEVEIDKRPYEEQSDGIISSYVPFRNGLFLSAAVTVAMSKGGNDDCVVVLGNHGSDFAYADCSPKFVSKMNSAIQEGTYGKAKFWSPLNGMTKAQVVSEGIRLNVPYELTWSCYEGGEKPCGKCASCICRIEAFRENGTEDQLEYQ